MDLMKMWAEMGPVAKGVAFVLVFMSMWSFGVAIERFYTFSQARKQSKLYAPQVAKHLKDFVSSSQSAVQAAIQAATMAPAPTPAAPTPVAYQQPGSAHLDNATQTSAQPVREQEGLGDAARRSKQRKACLELAKDNPSITCQ